jgi:hypothetical protein
MASCYSYAQIMKASLSFAGMIACGLLCLALGCGSNGGGSGQFSCSSMVGDGFTCVDYTGDSANMGARNSCTQSSQTVHEGELCPTAGVSGICTFTEGNGHSRVFYYEVEASGLPVLQTGCTDARGTWSTS